MRYILLIICLANISFSFSQNLDINLLRSINVDRNKQLDGVFKGVTETALPIAVGTPIVMFGVGLLTKDSVTTAKSRIIGASVIGASVLAIALKYAVNRPRPYVTYPDINNYSYEGTPSFPSGHTSAAFALATSVSLTYPKWYIIAPSFAWAGIVGYSRMDLGVHYPSDVLAGAVLGSASAWLCFKANKWINKYKIHHKKTILNWIYF